MTDLEDAWDRYPTTAAPVADIMRKGRQMNRARLARPALGGLVAAGVAAALVVTMSGGGSTPTGPAVTAVPIQVAAFKADLKPTSCAQLLKTFRQRGLKNVSAWGWSNGGVVPLAAANAGGEFFRASADLAHNFAGSGGIFPQATSVGKNLNGSLQPAQGNSATGTNVQELGVDEPDSVKANGSVLVRIDDNTLAIYDVAGDAPKRVSTLALPYFSNGQILISGSTLVAIGSDNNPLNTQHTGSRVETVSLSNPAAPTITSDVAYSSTITSARQHGSDIRLVMTSGLPALPFVQSGGGTPGQPTYTVKQARAINRKLVAESTLAQWLPTMDTGSGSKQYLNCDDVAVTPASVPLGTTSVVGFEVSAPTAVSAIGLSGQIDTAYESTDHLYLTSGGTQLGYCSCLYNGPFFGGKANKTAIFQFDLNGDQASHVATGTVNGSIADRYSMDEVGGVLRVATTTSTDTTPYQSSSVITLKQMGQSLKQDGRLDGLGKGETLGATRWFDDFAVVSTSNNIDPLYTIDLRNPAHPKLLGALQIPGFSTYFHPLGNGLLMGLGQNTTFGGSGEMNKAQAGLFDISNLTNVKRLAVITMRPWTTLNAGNDPHAFTWLPDHNVALTSVSTSTGSLVLDEIKVANGTLHLTVANLTTTDPSMVRTMELPNGKVVLMDGGKVTFLGL